MNDWQKDKQFRKLNEVKDTIEIKTLRGGHLTLVTNHELVVGDVVILDAGDKIVADMLMFESHGLVIDEASLTGESDPIKKHVDTDPWIRSGTQVHFIVHAVPPLCGVPDERGAGDPVPVYCMMSLVPAGAACIGGSLSRDRTTL